MYIKHTPCVRYRRIKAFDFFLIYLFTKGKTSTNNVCDTNDELQYKRVLVASSLNKDKFRYELKRWNKFILY